MQSALRDDALTSTPTGFRLRVGLPWIRSLPMACLRDPVVTVDDEIVEGLRVVIGGRSAAPDDLLDETTWWFAQDRVVLEADQSLVRAEHEVSVTFRLLIPYLMAGPGGGPLELPMQLARRLLLDHDPVPSVSRDVA